MRLTATVRSGESQPPTRPCCGGRALAIWARSPGGGSFFTGNAVQPPQAILITEPVRSKRHAPRRSADPTRHDGDFRFVGIDDHDFIATAVMAGQAQAEFVPVTLPGAGQTPAPLRRVCDSTFAKPPADVTFFVGPKQFDVLRSVDAELVRAIDFGMFAWLVVPLLGALKWLFGSSATTAGRSSR